MGLKAVFLASFIYIVILRALEITRMDLEVVTSIIILSCFILNIYPQDYLFLCKAKVSIVICNPLTEIVGK